MMAASEPWITLGRTYEASLELLTSLAKESYAVRVGDELAGFLILDMRGPLAGYIQTVCIAPPHQGRGLGTRVVRWAEDRIARDSPNVFMCVSSFNDGARRLYERMGYHVVGTFKDFLVTGHDELLLRKTRGPWSGFQKPRG